MIQTVLFLVLLHLSGKRGREMTTEIAPLIHDTAYKYKFTVLAAIIFPCLCRLALLGSGKEDELSRYGAALLIGALIGYLIDSLFGKVRQSLSVSQKINSRLEKKIQQQRRADAQYVAICEKTHSILLLINATTGQIEQANPCACAFYGYSLQQLQQMHITTLTTLPREKVEFRIDQARREGWQHFLLTHKMTTGEERDVEVFSGPILIEGTVTLFWVVRAMRKKKVLQGIIPICAHCKQIRAEPGNWSQIEEYIQRHAEVTFSHGLCPTCAYQHYPTIYELQKNG